MGTEYRAVSPHRLVLRGRNAPFIDVPERLNLEGRAVIRQTDTAKYAPQLLAFARISPRKFSEKHREFI